MDDKIFQSDLQNDNYFASGASVETKVESMVRLNKRNANQRFFNVEKQNSLAFVKASNVLLEPFSLTQRGQDSRA